MPGTLSDGSNKIYSSGDGSDLYSSHPERPSKKEIIADKAQRRVRETHVRIRWPGLMAKARPSAASGSFPLPCALGVSFRAEIARKRSAGEMASLSRAPLSCGRQVQYLKEAERHCGFKLGNYTNERIRRKECDTCKTFIKHDTSKRRYEVQFPVRTWTEP